MYECERGCDIKKGCQGGGCGAGEEYRPPGGDELERSIPQPGFGLRVVSPGIVAGSAWVDVMGHLLNVVVLDGFRKERAVSAA